jgi:uncharacterized membrane protein YhaH (DUF805 family)
MTASRPSEAERPVQVGVWGRCDAVLFAMAVTALVLTVVGFALASRRARAHRRTLWLAVVLAVLSVAQPPFSAASTRADPP